MTSRAAFDKACHDAGDHGSVMISLDRGAGQQRLVTVPVEEVVRIHDQGVVLSNPPGEQVVDPLPLSFNEILGVRVAP